MMLPRALRAPLAAGAMLAAGSGAWLLWRFDPNAAGSLFPPCLFRTFTGLYCPGCGLTRMLHALLHGDLAGAASMNLMVLAMLPLLAAIAANEGMGRRLLSPALASRLYDARAWIAVVVAFGVLRNLPWAPFPLLAPG